MIVEVHGAGFVNKGAALMLYTAISELRKRVPKIRIAADPVWGTFPERAGQQLWQLSPSRGSVLQPGFKSKFLKQKMAGNSFVFNGMTGLLGIHHERLGKVGLHQISALVDISGFLFSSQWGEAPSARFADLAAFYKSKGKKVILLPQTFGPFDTPGIRASVKKILRHADLICPRDTVSRDHLYSLGISAEEKERILLAPDITLNSIETPPPFERVVNIVPNARMLDRGDGWGERYFEWMRAVMGFLLDSKACVVQVAYHETSGEDEALVRKIWPDGLPEGVVVSQKHNPENVKKILAGSWMTIGSRYHALAGSLSCGVPAIGFGWAHKYQGLFDDFGCPELYFTPEQDPKDVLRIAGKLLNRDVRGQYQEKILAARKKMDSQLEDLWQRAAGILSEKCA